MPDAAAALQVLWVLRVRPLQHLQLPGRSGQQRVPWAGEREAGAPSAACAPAGRRSVPGPTVALPELRMLQIV